MSDQVRETPEPHVCAPVFLGEGECVCFECGAYYVYASTLDAEGLAECREDMEWRSG